MSCHFVWVNPAADLGAATEVQLPEFARQALASFIKYNGSVHLWTLQTVTNAPYRKNGLRLRNMRKLKRCDDVEVVVANALAKRILCMHIVDWLRVEILAECGGLLLGYRLHCRQFSSAPRRLQLHLWQHCGEDAGQSRRPGTGKGLATM